jgi:hypothetical protein
MSAYVELEDFVTPYLVELAHQRANEEQQKGNWDWAMIGLRAVRDRDPKIMKALEKAAEILQQMEEDQRRESRRTEERYSHTKESTEYQMWREAYRTADEGDPCENLMWIYGAAAFVAGYNRRKGNS